MKNSTLLPLLFSLLFLAACGQKSAEVPLKVTEAANFFENSRRVNAEARQKKGLARLGGCTGFSLKNEGNRNFVATARHCMNYDAPTWCANGSTVREEASGLSLRCLSVAVGDGRHDFVVLEVEPAERDRTLDFSMAGFALSANVRLEMMGYPADQYNTGRVLKLTQNCWVIRPSSTNIYDDPNVAADKVFTHNCSTYGGNSGGPMFIEGTRVAVGLPDTYAPGDFSQRRRNERAAQGVLASGFVEDFAARFAELGISVAQAAPQAVVGDYATEGRFSAGGACVIEVLRLSYNTHVTPIQMTVRLEDGCETQGSLNLTCQANMECTHPSGHLQINWQNGQSFQMEGEVYRKQ